MMRMFRAMVCGLVLVGCHAVFGLDPEADPCPGDRDCDAVLDLVDNCPDAPNSDQRDLERDGVGDACDPCIAPPLSEAHDADMDGIADRDDGCPSFSDASQPDGDGDGVGDACDPDPRTADAVRCFHDFGDPAYPSQIAWELDYTAWSFFGSVFQHFVPDPPPSVRLDASGLHPDIARFAIMTTARGNDGGAPPAELGLAVGGTAGALGLRCVLTTSSVFGDGFALVGGDNLVLASQPRTPTAANPVYQIQMVGERRALETAVQCSLRVAGDAPIVVSGIAPPLDGTPPIALVASKVEATFFDLVVYQLGP